MVKRFADENQLKLIHHLSSLGNIYQFVHEETAHRSKRSADDFLTKLRSHPHVVFAEQQKVLQRVKREILYDKQVELDSPLSNSEAVLNYYFGSLNKRGKQACSREENVAALLMDFDDEYACKQWYYRNLGDVIGKPGNDVGVANVWRRYNITGRGVVVTVLDDGVDYKHPDLAPNYDHEASLDLNGNDDDPTPQGATNANAHGTRCAGEIAAVPNNGLCGVGAAYGAKIGGVRLLDGRVTDSLEAQALSHARDHVDIYSASWGPRDDGKTMEGPSRFSKKALEDGVKLGRKGLGSVFVWATGNGGERDDCNCDGYVSSIYTISVGCINDQGYSTYFSEICPSTMVVIFTGGSHEPPGEKGYDHPPLSIITTDLNGKCNLDFEGTSSAAPLAAGLIALTLEANPNLSWRDIQNLLAETATIPNAEESGWTINAAGYHINPKFGFGTMNATSMVEAAFKWKPVAEQHICNVPPNNQPISLKQGGTIQQTLHTDGCQSAHDDTSVERLEHTQLHVRIKTKCRGCLNIKLTSAGQTVSEMLSYRELDTAAEEFEWTFMTVHNWGEDPNGEWTITITDKPTDNIQSGAELIEWSLTLYGVVGANPNHHEGSDSRVSKDTQKAYVADTQEIEAIMKDEKSKLQPLTKDEQQSIEDKQYLEKDYNKNTAVEKENKLKELKELAKLVLDKKDFDILNKYVLENKIDGTDSNAWWKREMKATEDNTFYNPLHKIVENKRNRLYEVEKDAEKDVTVKKKHIEHDIQDTIDMINQIINTLEDNN